jgi:nodulation protein F
MGLSRYDLLPDGLSLSIERSSFLPFLPVLALADALQSLVSKRNDINRRFDLGKCRELGRGVLADQLAQDIIDKIKVHAEPDGGEVTPQTELTALGIHSLELTEIIFDLEEAYGIDIEMNTVEAWSNLKNVGDMVEAVRELIAKKA